MPLHKTVPQRPPASPFIPPIASSFSHLRTNLKKTGVPYRILDRQAMLDIFAKREAILKDLLKPFVED